MTKSKKRQFQYPTTRTASSEKLPVTALRLKDYVLLNIGFSGFCLFQLVLIRIIMTDLTGTYFFFIFIMCAFLLVSIFDYVSTRLASPVDATAS